MASGNTLLFFPATAGVPGDADYATLDTLLTTSADEPDNIIPVLDFDPGATEEYTYFQAVMPSHYAGTTGVTVTLNWTSEATSGDCIWSVAFKALTDSENVLSTAFAAPNTGTTTTDGVARDLNQTVITFTDGADMDSVAAGDYFWIEVSRNSSAGGDTMNSNDAELHNIKIVET